MRVQQDDELQQHCMVVLQLHGLVEEFASQYEANRWQYSMVWCVRRRWFDSFSLVGDMCMWVVGWQLV